MKSFARPLVRDALPVALVALVVFQALRLFCLDRYLVPSDSMQPTLYGDAENGDVVLVDKLSRLWRGPPALHDLVVLRDPEDPSRHLVKRVAGREHQWVLLEEGDLWLGPDRQHLQRVVKDPLADADLRIPWLRWPAAGAGTEGEDPLSLLAGPFRPEAGELVLPPAAGSPAEWTAVLGEPARSERRATMPPRFRLPGFLATARAVDATYLDLEGRRGGQRGRGHGVRDAGMVVDFVPAEGLSGLLLVVQHEPDEVAWSFDAEGRLGLWRRGVRQEWAAETRPLQPGVARRLEFGFLDQHDFLAIDGELVAHRRRQPLADAPPPAWPDTPRNLLMVGAAGGELRIRRLTVFRDLYYFRDRQPFGDPLQEVGAGQIYLLGDNSFYSRDSRTRGPFALDQLVGRPLLVLAPVSRMRWLLR